MRARILATVLALAGLGILVTGVASAVVTWRQLVAAVDADLRTEADEFRAHVKQVAGVPGAVTDVRSLLRSALRDQVPMDDQVLLGMVDGVPAYVTVGGRPFPLEKEPALVARIAALPADDPIRIRQATTTSVGTVRYVTVQLQVTGEARRGVFVVATSLRPAHRSLIRNTQQYAMLSAGALVLIGVGGWLVAGRLLRPLRLLRTAADRISHTDLTSRIPVTGRDDVTQLTTTVNSMLDRLQWAFDAQQEFLDDAGHELRTPLTIVRGHLDVLDVGDPAEVAATRDLVVDELDRMTRLVNDLILLAQSRRPDFVRFEPVDLDRLLREALDKAQALAERRWVLDSVLPVVVAADAQRLTQALLQLADNAVKHTGPADLIAFGAREDAEGILLWVRDSGPGVPEADAERIFERFQRSRPSRGAEGSGLGLSIVSGIAAAHGGAGHPRPRPARGHVRTGLAVGGAGTGGSAGPLPAIRGPVTAPSRAGRNGDLHRRHDMVAPVNRILVAEDEQRISSFIEKGLRASGFAVTVVTDGPMAYEAAMSGGHDLILLDLGLPLLDGFAVLQRLRQSGNRTPVIILTARSGLHDTVAGLQGGADDYIAKPFRFDELVARIRLRLRAAHPTVEVTVLRYGDLALDLTTRRAAVNGREVDLSTREYHLLETLLRHPGQVLTREQLLSQVWGYDFDPGSNVVDVYVRYLRRKLGSGRIQTVRGAGYRLTEGGHTADR